MSDRRELDGQPDRAPDVAPLPRDPELLAPHLAFALDVNDRHSVRAPPRLPHDEHRVEARDLGPDGEVRPGQLDHRLDAPVAVHVLDAHDAGALLEGVRVIRHEVGGTALVDPDHREAARPVLVAGHDHIGTPISIDVGLVPRGEGHAPVTQHLRPGL